MKKVRYIILFFFTFSIVFLNPKAASQDDFKKMQVTYSEEENLCVYSPSNSQIYDSNGNPITLERYRYIVIVFSKTSELGGYKPLDYTLQSSLGYVNNISFFDASKVYDSKDCGKYYITLERAMGVDAFYLNLTTNRPSNYYFSYSTSMTSKFKQEAKVTVTKKEDNPQGSNCVFSIGGIAVNLGAYVSGSSQSEGSNYFLTDNNNLYACPATFEKNTTGMIYQRITINPKITCSDWKLVDNPTYSPDAANETDNKCRYYLVSSKETTPSTGSQGEDEGNLVATYADYGSSSLSIRIIKKEDGSYKAILSKNNQEIEISNLNTANGQDFITKFNSGDKTKYPMWINEITTSGKSTYQLSDSKLDGANNRNYIEVSKIHEIVKLGNTEIYKTCEELFTTDFLTFINNTFLRILYIAIPIILIVLTTFDFAKVVFNNDTDGLKAAGKKFGKRVVIAVLIYLVPTIIIFVANLMGANEVQDCVKTMQRISEENPEN